jgi:hypothetical protein
MSFIASDSGSFSILEPGVYPARCVSVINLGMQNNDFDASQKPKQRMAFEFEVIGESRDDGDALLMYKEFTLSLHSSSALRPFLEAWRGRAFSETELKGFDVSTTLGAACRLLVNHKTTVKGQRAVIDGIQAVRQSEVGPARSPLLKYDADCLDLEILQKLPKFIQEKIAKAVKPEPEPVAIPKPEFDDLDWDVGFKPDEAYSDELDRRLELADVDL